VETLFDVNKNTKMNPSVTKKMENFSWI